MRRALELADGGRGRVSPNPLVGAVLIRDRALIGEGFHAELGALHAERAALADCRARGEDPAGATMYVTLEPCAHQGRQPPCVEAILEAGVSRVVIASEDPSEKAAGRGPRQLREAGVEVVDSDPEDARAARLLNQPFRKHARTGRPLVTLKMAISLEGRTATAPGDSPWISGEQSRRLVHRWRAQSDAIAVGIGTVFADDPLLSAREVEAPRQPTRVVFDRRARLPLDSQLLATLDIAPVLVLVAPDADPAPADALRRAGAEVLPAAGIDTALEELGKRGLTSLFLEGGPTLAAAFIGEGAVDQARTFVAPILLGSAGPCAGGGSSEGPRTEAKPPPAGPSKGVAGPARQVALSSTIESVGDDALIKTTFKEW